MIKEILVMTRMDKKETWGSLTKACRSHTEFKYHTIKKLKYPFRHKGWLFEKIKHNENFIKTI